MKFVCLILGLLLNFKLYADHKIDTDLSVMYEYAPPFAYFEDGQAKGIYVREINQLFHQANLSVTHEIYPFIRAIKRLKTHPKSLLFSMVKSQERTPHFTWLGVLDSLCPSLLRLSQRTDIQINKKTDVQQYRITLIRQDYISSQLQREKWLDLDNVLWVADLAQAYQLLINNKVDLMAADPFHMQLIANHLQQIQKSLVSAFDLTQYQRQLYLAANADIAPRIQQALSEAIKKRSKILTAEKNTGLRFSCQS